MPSLFLHSSLNICFRSLVVWCSLFSVLCWDYSSPPDPLRVELLSLLVQIKLVLFFNFFSLCGTRTWMEFLLSFQDSYFFSFDTDYWFLGSLIVLSCSWAWICFARSRQLIYLCCFSLQHFYLCLKSNNLLFIRCWFFLDSRKNCFTILNQHGGYRVSDFNALYCLYLIRQTINARNCTTLWNLMIGWNM